jgi:hypothetical protein
MQNASRNKIVLVSQTKKDGVYSVAGILYRVKGGAPTHYASRGEIIAMHGYFDVVVGKYTWSVDYEHLVPEGFERNMKISVQTDGSLHGRSNVWVMRIPVVKMVKAF